MSHKSYVRGSTQVALTDLTIGDYFDEIVKKHADTSALVSRAESIRWTWQQLHEQVLSAAAGLLPLAYSLAIDLLFGRKTAALG